MPPRRGTGDNDLEEGRGEWVEVPEIVRLTFKALHDVVKAQGEAIKNLERGLAQKVGKSEQASALAEKVNLSEIGQTFDELSRVIDAKADGADVAAALERKAGRSEVQAALKLKADVGEVQRCLDQKANVEELEALQAGSASAADVARVRAELEGRADAAAQGAPTHAEAEALVERRLAALQAQLDEALENKADTKKFAAAVAAKASREEVELLLSQHSSQVTAALSAKADVESVASHLAGKASRAEVLEQFDQKGLELRAALERALDEKVMKGEVAARLGELERRVAAARAEASTASEGVAASVARVERELQAHVSDVEGWLAAKASGAEVALKAATTDVELGLQRRPDRAELTDALDALGARLANEQKRGASELRATLDEWAATVGELAGAVRRKPDKEEVEAMRQQLASGDALREALSGKASVDEMNAQLALKAQQTGLALQQKVDGRELRQAVERVEARIASAADELRGLVAGKADRGSVEGVVQQLLLKANVHDAVGLLDTKANVDDVNKSLTEVNRELAQRPTLGELNRVVGEQSLIMESLCSEHLLGRWIWKSGHTKGEKKLVPWNVQNINTNPENFTWEKDKTVIVTAAPGLYEVTFGFFTKRKPQVIATRAEFHTRPHASHAPSPMCLQVQLLVNGEPVLSAVNSSSYAVHHSSGRLAAVGPHSAGNVTGLTLVDFLALPPKAKVGITYQGEEGGEGFLGLRKM